MNALKNSGLILFIVLSILALSTFIKPANAATTFTGKASWYGSFHHGKKMANGQRFNMYAPTVAHKTLPFGTKLRITNLKNGKVTTATVTDRGPYSGGRVIDLSKGVASKLDLVRQGVGQVRVEVISKPKKPASGKDVAPLKGTPKLINPADDSIGKLIASLSHRQLTKGDSYEDSLQAFTDRAILQASYQW